MRRAILGGTFDPPHLAHLFAGEAAFRQLDVDVVTFIPAGDPWQKADLRVTPAHHRWAMTQLAVEGVDYFEADRREIDRDGWTYTIDTLATFAAGDDLALILGSDAASALSTWHRSIDVIERATIAVMPRPGTTIEDVRTALPTARIEELDTPSLRISGSELRRRAANGHSLRFLVGEEVWRYVEQHKLYRSGVSDT